MHPDDGIESRQRLRAHPARQPIMRAKVRASTSASICHWTGLPLGTGVTWCEAAIPQEDSASTRVASPRLRVRGAVSLGTKEK